MFLVAGHIAATPHIGMHLNSDDVVDGRYKILSSIGEGGMGTVYKAVELGLGRTVALKFIHSSLLADRETRSRFFREGKTLARMAHPNILTFYRFGLWNAQYPFIAMEFAEGKTLREVLLLEQRLDWRRALSIASQVAAGMSYAHQNKVVHRDLKPNNIMLLKDEADSHRVKIIDFGLARANAKIATDDTLTKTGLLVGSVHYMSPEQCAGEKADHRADIYSLGCILFELVKGDPPFTCDNPIGLIHLHRTETVPKLSEVEGLGDVPREVDAIVAKAMEKSPGRRYQTMDELRHDLQTVAGMEHTEVAIKRGERKVASLPVVLAMLVAAVIGIIAIVAEGSIVSALGATLIETNLAPQAVPWFADLARTYGSQNKFGPALKLYSACIDSPCISAPSNPLVLRLLTERGVLRFRSGDKLGGRRDVDAAFHKLAATPDSNLAALSPLAVIVFSAFRETGPYPARVTRNIVLFGLRLHAAGLRAAHDKAMWCALSTCPAEEQALVAREFAWALRYEHPSEAIAMMDKAVAAAGCLPVHERSKLYLQALLVYTLDKERQKNQVVPAVATLAVSPADSALKWETFLDNPEFSSLAEPDRLAILKRFSLPDMPLAVQIRNARRVASISAAAGTAAIRQVLATDSIESADRIDALVVLADFAQSPQEKKEALRLLSEVNLQAQSPERKQRIIQTMASTYLSLGESRQSLALFQRYLSELKTPGFGICSVLFRTLIACDRLDAALSVLNNMRAGRPLGAAMLTPTGAESNAFGNPKNLECIIEHVNQNRSRGDGRLEIPSMEKILSKTTDRSLRLRLALVLALLYRDELRGQESLELLKHEVEGFPKQDNPVSYVSACRDIGQVLVECELPDEGDKYLLRAQEALDQYIKPETESGDDSKNEYRRTAARIRAGQIEAMIRRKQFDLAQSGIKEFGGKYKDLIDSGDEASALQAKLQLLLASGLKT